MNAPADKMFRWVTGGKIRYYDVRYDVSGRVLSCERAEDCTSWPRVKIPVNLDDVQQAVSQALEWRKLRRRKAAMEAAETRRNRRERKVYQIVERLKANQTLRPSNNCDLCGRGLTDEESISRGVGSECWGSVLALLEEHARPQS